MRIAKQASHPPSSFPRRREADDEASGPGPTHASRKRSTRTKGRVTLTADAGALTGRQARTHRQCSAHPGPKHPEAGAISGVGVWGQGDVDSCRDAIFPINPAPCKGTNMTVSTLFDSRVHCLSIMTEINARTYLSLVKNAYANRGGLSHQRAALKTASGRRIRERMVKDIIGGAVLEPDPKLS